MLLICFPITEPCQGICKVLSAMWKAWSGMPTYTGCSVYASAYAHRHKTNLLRKGSFCWPFFFQATHTWSVPLSVLIVMIRALGEGGDPRQNTLNFHSIVAFCVLLLLPRPPLLLLASQSGTPFHTAASSLQRLLPYDFHPKPSRFLLLTISTR